MLAAAADGVIVVVGMGQVTRPEVERALGGLTRADARVLGFVANRVAVGGWGRRRQARAQPPQQPAAAEQPAPAEQQPAPAEQPASAKQPAPLYQPRPIEPPLPAETVSAVAAEPEPR